ncbi:MAG: hypothetical protein ACE15E_20095 [Acidobacteriota bacterium]
MYPRPCLGLIFLFAAGLSPAGLAAPQEEEIDYALVRANPILREVLSTHAPYPEVTSQSSVEHKFRENWVDNQVDHFVRQTHLKLTELKANVQRASSASSDLAAIDSDKRGRALATLRQALAKAEDQSKDLRDRLSMVLVDLPGKDNFDIKVDQGAKAQGFEVELQLLAEQTAHAERSIRDYFFKPTHVTSVTDLQAPNMLDYLKRVERIARAIRERL